MRKSNSEINVHYLSNPGKKLHNNDWYGSAELSGFACYVVADGIEEGSQQDLSAQIAVEAAIEAFTESPSISRIALNRYIQRAHKALHLNSYSTNLKASISIFVTNYQKARVAHVGNARCTIYRKSLLRFETQDDSLSWELMDDGEFTKDKIAEHQERTNLSKFIGQKGGIIPNISRKIKLEDGDYFSLYTKGIWELAGQTDMQASFVESDRDPEKAVQTLERVMLDNNPNPKDLDNYTLWIGFVERLYVDPNKAKRKKLIMRIAVPVIIILMVLGIILFFRNRKRKENKANMEMHYHNGLEYIQSENFVLAKEEMADALKYATTNKDKKNQLLIGNHQKLVEGIIKADDELSNKDFTNAGDSYLRAKERSAFTAHLGVEYIDKRLDISNKHASVHDFINLGDSLAEKRMFKMAEEKYLVARGLASEVYYMEGKTQAIEALNTLYIQMESEEQASKDAAQSAVEAEMIASELLKQGDVALDSGDLVEAKLNYEMAKEAYKKLENEEKMASIEKRMELVEDSEMSQTDQYILAAEYMTNGLEFKEQGLYAEAKEQLIYTRDIYARLGDESLLSVVNNEIDIIDGFIANTKNKPAADGDLIGIGD